MDGEDSDVNDFNKFLKETKVRNVYKQQIILKIDLINKLLTKGNSNSLRQVYNYLYKKEEITCTYAHFLRIYKTLMEDSNNKKTSIAKSIAKKPDTKQESKTVDVSFKPIASLDDGITEEEMKELMEQQKRILNRRN